MKFHEQFIIDLKGFSGCKVKLFLRNDDYFVRKISKSITYNERLQKQALKQKFFLDNLATERLSAPKILEEGFVDNLFF